MKHNFINLREPVQRRQERIDRRSLSFKSFMISFYNGRRVKARRFVELEQGYYTDRYEKQMAWSACAIILLSALDAFFTLNILERGGVEVNPIMLILLDYNTSIFLIGKMSVTITCVLFALMHVNFHVFRIFSMKLMLKAILTFYFILIGYEIYLLRMM